MLRAIYDFKQNSEYKNKCVVVCFESKEELDLAEKYVEEKYGKENIDKCNISGFWEYIQEYIEENNLELIEEKYLK